MPQGISKLNFMNLGSGKYKLEVQALSPVDKQILTSTDLNIRVYPPFYFAWYAFLVYVLLVVLVVWWYIRSKLRFRTKRKKKNILRK
ncbi:hypothetical protein JZU68_07985 [bacterium]|nr:hypothetical protein [bacterium]